MADTRISELTELTGAIGWREPSATRWAEPAIIAWREPAITRGGDQ